MFTVAASYPDYGSTHKEVLPEDHMEIEIDITKGSPLAVFPSFNAGNMEFGVLILPIAIFVIYAKSSSTKIQAEISIFLFKKLSGFFYVEFSRDLTITFVLAHVLSFSFLDRVPRHGHLG